MAAMETHFVLQTQLDSFLRLLTGERGKVNIILLPTYYLEQSGLKSEQCALEFLLADFYGKLACLILIFLHFKIFFPFNSSFFSHLK